MWSPVAYSAGTTRGTEGVEAVTELVYDVDGTHPDWNLLAGVAYVAYTTYSHLTVCEHNPTGGPCWRLVLRLAEPVPAAEWATAWRRARARYVPMADPSCSDASRMYYLPTCPPGQRGATQIGQGAPVDPHGLPETPEEVQEREVQAVRPAARSATAGAVNGERVGDRFMRETSWAELLEPEGWRSPGEHGGRQIWNRPGRTDDREARSANRFCCR